MCLTIRQTTERILHLHCTVFQLIPPLIKTFYGPTLKAELVKSLLQGLRCPHLPPYLFS